MEDLKLLIASNESDILMLTEVIPKRQVNPIEESQITLNGYVRHTNFEISDSNLGASGIRGTAIFVKEELKGRKVTIMNEFDDHVWIELQLKNNDKLLCGCIYRSPKKELQYIKDSTKKVCKVIQEATNMHPSHLLICGDFNYPEIDWIHESVVETTETIQPFIDTIQSCYLLQHIFEPTRFRDGNEPGLLDLVFTNEEGMIGNIIQNPGLGESDHICINFDLNC